MRRLSLAALLLCLVSSPFPPGSGSSWNGRGPARPIQRRISRFSLLEPAKTEAFLKSLSPELQAALGRLPRGKALLKSGAGEGISLAIKRDLGPYVATYDFAAKTVEFSGDMLEDSLHLLGETSPLYYSDYILLEPGQAAASPRFESNLKEPRILRDLARALAPAYYHELFHSRQDRELGVYSRERGFPTETEQETQFEEAAFFIEDLAADPAFYRAHFNDPIVTYHLDKMANALSRDAAQTRRDVDEFYKQQGGYVPLADMERNAPGNAALAVMHAHFYMAFSTMDREWPALARKGLPFIVQTYASGNKKAFDWLSATLKKNLPAGELEALAPVLRESADAAARAESQRLASEERMNQAGRNARAVAQELNPDVPSGAVDASPNTGPPTVNSGPRR